MKCPNCGTTNGKTNRFCRGCGLKLENLPEVQAHDSQPECEFDKDALGRELFEIWQDYSAGNLETALIRAEKVISCTPESASAHSVLALIYERKAEKEFAAGDIETGQDMLKLAIAQYERIIELNPDSVADREKLASLRKLLEGQSLTPPRVPEARHIFDLKAAYHAVPKPVLAGFGTMLVLLIVGTVVFLPGGRSDHSAKSGSARQDGPQSAPVSVVTSPGATLGSPGPSASGSNGLSVYTFPAPAPKSATTPGGLSVPRPPAPSGGVHRTPSVEPMKLPPLGGAQVTVVPESKGKADGTKKPDAAPHKQENGAETGTGSITIGPSKATDDTTSQTADGSSTLARAIELHNQGKTSEAITTAQQAISLYNAEAEAGRNAAAAKRGAENARKLIQLWQQSAASE